MHALLFPLAKEIQEWRFAASSWSAAAAFLVAVGVIAYVAVAYLLEPRSEGRSGAGRFFLGATRVLAILVAVAILFRPVESKETSEVKDGYVVVAIDKSRSMSLKDREQDPKLSSGIAAACGVDERKLRDMDRLARVKAALLNAQTHVLRALATKNRLKLYSFDAGRQRLSEVERLEKEEAGHPGTHEHGAGDGPGAASGEDEKTAAAALSAEASLERSKKEIQGLEADGPSTALGDSLQRILSDLRSERVAALVLLTDGRSNSGSLAPDAVAARFGRKGVKVFAIGVGDPEPPKDLAIDSLEAPDVSIAGDVISFDYVVRAQGYPGPKEITVELRFDGNVVQRKQVVLGGDRTEKGDRIRYKPEKPGEYNVEVRVPPDEAEITTENNRVFHRLRVIDQRIKVLCVEGYPRWEWRFLKNAMVRDKNLEVQCLLLSADPGAIQEATKGVAQIHAFPTREDLLQYHVVILGDVSPQALDATGRPVFPEGSLEALKEFVGDQGGGLLMISGEQDSPRRWVSTPVGPLLPIQIDEAEVPTNREWNEPWKPRLTREGLSSPILRLVPDSERNRELWEGTGPSSLPGFFWYARTLKPKPLARILAEHPTEKNANGNYPIFAWQYYKSGTVFWSGIDETWRWRSGIGDRYMYQLWQQVLRFLAHGRFQRSKRFLVTTDKGVYNVGEEVRVSARVLDRKFQPASDKSQEVQIERPDGQQEKLELKLIEGRPGQYEGRLKPAKVGVYKVSIDPGSSGGEGEVAPRIFEVKFPSIELEEPRMDEAGLRKIAETSGGRFLRLDELPRVPEEVETIREMIPIAATERELWDNGFVLAAFAAFVIVEWIGRKIARLL